MNTNPLPDGCLKDLREITFYVVLAYNDVSGDIIPFAFLDSQQALDKWLEFRQTPFYVTSFSRSIYVNPSHFLYHLGKPAFHSKGVLKIKK